MWGLSPRKDGGFACIHKANAPTIPAQPVIGVHHDDVVLRRSVVQAVSAFAVSPSLPVASRLIWSCPSTSLLSPISGSTTTRLRLMGANISTGNKQSYDPGEGKRIFLGIKPDVVDSGSSTYGNNSATDIRSFIDSAFGSSFSYYREGGAQIPNGVIGRYRFVDSGEWDDSSSATATSPGPASTFLVRWIS